MRVCTKFPIARILLTGFVVLATSGCTSKSNLPLSGNTFPPGTPGAPPTVFSPPPNGTTPTTPPPIGTLPSIPVTGGGTGSGGSGAGGTVTQGDQAAVNQSAGQANAVIPQTVTPQDFITPAIQAQIDAILAASRNGESTTAQRFALIGGILQGCMDRVATLAPLPGQPLLGTWNGAGACAVTFVVAPGQGGTYTVTGGTVGSMTADNTGAGLVSANPFSGPLSDSPEAGHGALTHPTFHRTKSGTQPCTVQVNLDEPTSPIPENYREAMRITGACFRQALLLVSPALDNMNAATRDVLLQQYLGLQGS